MIKNLNTNQQEDISSKNFYCIVNNGNVLVKLSSSGYHIYPSYESALDNIKILDWFPRIKPTPEIERFYMQFLNKLFCD